VTFKVASRYLEHTLTRDNVRRDRGFGKVLDLVRRLAAGPLAERLRQELPAAAAQPERRRDYRALLGYAYVQHVIDNDELSFPRCDGGAASGKEVRKAARTVGHTLFASAGDPVAAALLAKGVPVLAEEGDWVAIAAQVAGLPLMRVSAVYSLAQPTTAPTPGGAALCSAMAELLRAAGAPATSVFVGAVAGADAGQLGMLCREPGVPEPQARAGASPFGRRAPPTLCLNEAAPAVAAAARVAVRAPALAAGLCLRALAMRWGALDPELDWRITGAMLRAGAPGTP